MKIINLTDSLSEYHSYWIRIGQYMEILKKRHSILITDEAEYIEYMKAGDILILYRHKTIWGDISTELKEARRKGIKVISDVDDYLWNDGEQRGWNKTRLRNYTKALKECNIITCSTATLNKQLKTMFKKQEIITVENTEPIISKRSVRGNKEIRVGWTGAPWTRPEDLKELKELGTWLSKKEKLKLVHIGHLDGYLSLAEAINIPEACVEKINLRTHKDYLESLDFDIGLAPMKENCFNYHKSPIKIIEYSSFKIPWIASNTEAYRDKAQKWNNDSYLCKEGNDWIDCLERLLNDEARKVKGEQLYKTCMETNSFGKGIKDWESIIMK